MKAIDILWGKVEEKVVEETEKVTPAIGIGSVLSDGYIIYAQTATEWLAVAPATKRADYTWGPYGTARGTTSYTDGYANTDTLQGFGSTAHRAADFAWNNSRSPTEGGTGSYLPSKYELDTIYKNKGLIDAADTSGGAFTLAAIGDFTAVRPIEGSASVAVWSSTEDSSGYSWFQYFASGSQSSEGFKGNYYWVVPMRRIYKYPIIR